MEYCFFTPSYRNDLDRVLVLRKSINKYINEILNHYLIVPENDFNLFKKIFSNDRSVIILKQNDFVDKYFYPEKAYSLIKKLCPSQLWRFNEMAGRPGWIIQQIIKLSIPKIIDEDIAIILDSDIFFIKPISVYELFPSTDRILVRNHPLTESGMHRNHISKSRDILKLTPGNTNFHYMSWPVIWYKDYVTQLQKYLSLIYKGSWEEQLFKAIVFSEYNLYGIFFEEILKPKNPKIITSPLHLGIWDKDDFSKFIHNDITLKDDIVCIVVQSNLNIPTDQYKKQISHYLEKH